MSSQRKQYPFPEFEPKWQQHWAETQAYRTPNPGEAGFDAAKVQQLRADIEAGRYTVDSRALAARLMEIEGSLK